MTDKHVLFLSLHRTLEYIRIVLHVISHCRVNHLPLLFLAFPMQTLIRDQRRLSTRISTFMVLHGTCVARKAMGTAKFAASSRHGSGFAVRGLVHSTLTSRGAVARVSPLDAD